MLTATVALLALSGVAQAQVTDNDECSNATLQDDYGFTVHGEFLGLVAAGGPQYFSSPVPIDVVAMTNFDGRGKLVQVDFTVVNGVNPPALPSNVDPQTGFTVNESGQYTVFPDCTGNLELNLPGIFVAAKFVLADQGRKVHSLIYRQHVASPILGCTSSGGCDTLVQSHSDGTKLRRGRERDD
jgi:hypothetical protein